MILNIQNTNSYGYIGFKFGKFEWEIYTIGYELKRYGARVTYIKLSTVGESIGIGFDTVSMKFRPGTDYRSDAICVSEGLYYYKYGNRSYDTFRESLEEEFKNDIKISRCS